MPPLDIIQVAAPCTASWEHMRGDERSRLCAECGLRVYNLSGMSRAAAEKLIQKKEGRLCVRFYRREDGTILTQDCPVGRENVSRAFRRLGAVAAGLGVLCFGAILWSFGDSPGVSWFRKTEPFATLMEWISPRPQPVVMGAICIPQPPPQTAPTPEKCDEPAHVDR
jgi:hypothetical protein